MQQPQLARIILSLLTLIIAACSSGDSVRRTVASITVRKALYFTVGSAVYGYEVWRYTGSGEPERLTDINPGLPDASPWEFTAFDERVYFSADDGTNGNELWAIDWDGEHEMVHDINAAGDASPSGLTVFKGALYFTANSAAGETQLWKHDGTNTTLVKTLSAAINKAGSLTVFKDKLYFSADDGTNGAELWVYDGTADPAMVADLYAGAGNSAKVASLTVYGDKLYFLATDGTVGEELYAYDGTNAPALAADVRTGGLSCTPQWPVVFNDKLYFQCYHTGDLWSFDGTTATLIPNTAPAYSTPQMLAAFGDHLVFNASGANGFELFAYDGTNDPVEVLDIYPGGTDGFPDYFAEFNGRLYFNATDDVAGSEVWSWDGVNPPAVAFDLEPGITDSFPGEFVYIEL